jgi:myo-inositol-1(or 4)-monophosphatase
MKEIAIQAAMEAGLIQKLHLGKIQSDKVGLKKKFDYVTEVDHASEAKIIEVIKGKYPDHKFFAEETVKDGPGGYRWIVDPLDGTTNYIHALPVFAVSIALEYEGEIILGVVYDPSRDDLFVAEKGKGAFLNGRRIHVSRTKEFELCLLGTGFPFKSKAYLDAYLASFEKLLLQTSGIRRMGAVAIDFCYLACGRFDGFWEIGLSPWDVAAGYLIIKEAGGVMTDFFGGNDPIWSGNVIASNGKIHETMLRELREIFAGKIDK